MEKKEIVKNLAKLSDVEIEKILKEAKEEKKKTIAKPEILEAKIVVKNLYELALIIDKELSGNVDFAWNEGNWVFEAFMVAIYGKDFWKWYNLTICN